MYLKTQDCLLSIAEYLAAETTSQTKHEYLGGRVYAMSGASRNHNLIAGNIFALIRNHLRDTNCRAFISDMKIKIESQQLDIFYYPDIVVTCNPQDNEKFS